MRTGLTVSVIAHAVIIGLGLVSLASTEPFEAPVEAVPIDLVKADDVTSLDKGLKTAAIKPAPSPNDPAPAPKDTTGEMLTFHPDGGVNLIPWDYTTSVQAPNDQGLRALGFRQSYYTSLPTGQSGQVLYSVGGGTDDWAYAKLGIAAGTW